MIAPVALFLSRINPVAVVNTVATVVGLVESVFSRKRGQGARKRKRALRLLTKTAFPEADLHPQVFDLVAVLVDILGKAAGSNEAEVVTKLLAVFSTTEEVVHLVSGLVNDDDATRAVVVEFLNGEIDIPVLNEQTEAFLIGAVVDFSLHKLRQVPEDIPF